MNNLNTVLIEGQLTRNPDQGFSPAQTQSCKLSIANNRYYLDKEGKWKQDASYFNVFVFGNVAGTCMTYLRKGRGVRIVGRLKQFSWTDQGIRREKICILAEHIEFQPVKKTEPLKEPDHDGEIRTKADMHGLDDLPADESVNAPAQEPSETPADAPECIIDPADKDDEKEDYDQASGF